MKIITILIGIGSLTSQATRADCVGKFTASSILEYQRKNIASLHLMVDAEQGYGPDLQKVLDQFSHDLGSLDFNRTKAIVIDRIVQGDQNEAYCPVIQNIPTLSKFEDIFWDLTIAIKTHEARFYLIRIYPRL